MLVPLKKFKWIAVRLFVSCIFISGCAIKPSPVWVAPPEEVVEFERYRDTKTGILPVAFGKHAKFDAVLSRDLHFAIKDTLSILEFTSDYTEIIDPARIGSRYTPYEMSDAEYMEIGRQLGLRTLIIPKIYQYWPEDRFRDRRIVLSIRFLNSWNPKLHWQLTRVLEGEEHARGQLDNQTFMKEALTETFTSVRRTGHLASRSTKFADNGPIVSVAEPVDELSTEKDNIRLSYLGFDNDGISYIEVENSDAEHKTKVTIEPAQYTVFDSIRLPLSLGDNKIKITARNTKGFEASRKLRVSRHQALPKRWVYSISLDHYQEYDSVQSATYYAEKLASFLDSGRMARRTRIIALSNHDANLQEVRKALDYIRVNANPQDTVVIYFSGRVERVADSLRLILNDTQTSYVDVTSIDASEIARSLPNVRRLVVIDGCVKSSWSTELTNEENAFASVDKLNLSPDYIIGVRACGAGLDSMGRILRNALRREADADRDETISSKEITDYIYNAHPYSAIDIPSWSELFH